MWRRKKRPIWPGHATVQEAIGYLASACDGAVRKDGHGFSTDHVVYGHWLAHLPDQHWHLSERQNGLHLARVYRRQLARAGFNPDQLMHSTRPRRLRKRQANQLQPRWAPDPTGVHTWRWWNGARWTQWAQAHQAEPFGHDESASRSTACP